MPASPFPNMSVSPDEALDAVVEAPVLELLEELLSSLPHAARKAPNAATAPVLPIAVRKRLRDDGSRSSPSSADRSCGRSLSWVIGSLLVSHGLSRVICRRRPRAR